MGDHGRSPIAENIARRAVDEVHAEALAPILAPIILVESFDDKDEFLDVLGNGFNPFVIGVTVDGLGGSQEFNDRAEGALGRKEWTARRFFIVEVTEAVAVVAVDDSFCECEVFLEIAHEDRATDDGVGD